MSKKVSLLALVVVAAVAAALAAGFSGTARSATSGVTPLPSSSCGPVVYKGSGAPDYIVASDLPLQGAIRHQTVQISRGPSGSKSPSTSPFQPSRTPITSPPPVITRRPTARMTAFNPGQSPPPVKTPTFMERS